MVANQAALSGSRSTGTMTQELPPHQHGPYQGSYPPYQHEPYRGPYAAHQPASRPPHNPARGLVIVLGAITMTALLVAGILVFGLHHGTTSPMRALLPGTQQQANGGGSGESLDTDAIARKVEPGLVDVNTTLGFQGGQAAGTGMVLTPDGEVLTNNHVVEGATSIEVTDIGDGQTYKATVVGYDRSEDVAVLKLRGASGLATVSTGDSSKVAAGDAVVGIGNAGGAGGTPSVAPGTVSALDESITASDESSGSSEQLSGLIQVNANIQSGDSGGPLVDSSGEVIGMNTAASTGYRFDRRGDDQTTGGGTGYAIPVNQALTIARQIESRTASKNVHIGDTAFLGVSVTDSTSGAAVRELVQGGPAQQAGLSAGDVITAINGSAIDSATTLTTVMDQHHPGDEVTLSWLDAAGGQSSATVTLAEGPVG